MTECIRLTQMLCDPTGVFIFKHGAGMLFFGLLHYSGRKLHDSELEYFASVGKLGVLISFVCGATRDIW